MPKEGFRSITLSESVYKIFNDDYLKSKDSLAIRGIRSFSGYVSFMLEARMQKDEILARHPPIIKKVSVDDDRIVLLDNIKNRITEIVVRNKELFCQLCEKDNCLHVGFAYALPGSNILLNEHTE